MANYDRERDERVFDGGEDDDENEGSHLPVVIIIAILVLAAFGGVVWLAYNQGVARGRNDVPARMAATTKPDDSGIKVYQQPAGQEEADDTKTPKTADATPAAPPAAPPQIQTPPVQPAPAPSAVAQPAPPPAPIAPPPRIGVPSARVAQAAPAAPPPKPQQQTEAAKVQPATEEPAKPQVATKPPAQLGGSHPAAATAPTVAKTAAVKPEPVKPAPTKPEAPAKAAASGSYLLQVGAYKSDDEAHAAWKAYQAKHAALLAGFSPDVQRTTHDDGSVWYRLRIASFADKDAAQAVCDRLKSQGGACFLAK